MHPGRLTHLHEGLPTTNGTRYIAVSFIDPWTAWSYFKSVFCPGFSFFPLSFVLSFLVLWPRCFADSKQLLFKNNCVKDSLSNRVRRAEERDTMQFILQIHKSEISTECSSKYLLMLYFCFHHWFFSLLCFELHFNIVMVTIRNMHWQIC